MRPAGALEGGVLEVLRCVLVRVLPRQREDLLVSRYEIGHASNCTVQFFLSVQQKTGISYNYNNLLQLKEEAIHEDR